MHIMMSMCKVVVQLIFITTFSMEDEDSEYISSSCYLLYAAPERDIGSTKV